MPPGIGDDLSRATNPDYTFGKCIRANSETHALVNLEKQEVWVMDAYKRTRCMFQGTHGHLLIGIKIMFQDGNGWD